MTDTPRRIDEDTTAPRSDGVPEADTRASFDELQPESQGEGPLDAELGSDGQGDILPENQADTSGRDAGPDDLRVEDLP